MEEITLKIESMIWNTRKEKSSNQKSRKKKKFKKTRLGLGTSLNIPTSES